MEQLDEMCNPAKWGLPQFSQSPSPTRDVYLLQQRDTDGALSFVGTLPSLDLKYMRQIIADKISAAPASITLNVSWDGRKDELDCKVYVQGTEAAFLVSIIKAL